MRNSVKCVAVRPKSNIGIQKHHAEGKIISSPCTFMYLQGMNVLENIVFVRPGKIKRISSFCTLECENIVDGFLRINTKGM